jgi:hypothetical protein
MMLERKVSKGWSSSWGLERERVPSGRGVGASALLTRSDDVHEGWMDKRQTRGA